MFVELNANRCMQFALSIDHNATVESQNTVVLTPYSFLRKTGDDQFVIINVDQINYEISSTTVHRDTLNPELLARFNLWPQATKGGGGS